MAEKKSIDALIEYCRLVALNRASVERFPATIESVLVRKVGEFHCKETNPFSRPTRMEKEFGKFDVA